MTKKKTLLFKEDDELYEKKNSHRVKTKSRKLQFSLIITVLVFVILGEGLIYISRHKTSNNSKLEATSSTPASIGVIGITKNAHGTTYITADELLLATNKVRLENGISALKSSPLLVTSSLAKCNDMVQKNYWSHNTPEGKDPWIFMDAVGYKYIKAGENLAYGFTTSNDVIIGWMNSPVHRKDLLDKEFTEVGLSVCKSAEFVGTGAETIVVQHFGTPPPLNQPAPVSTYKPPVQKPYVAPACTKIPIPYKTIYKDASYMYTDETSFYGGYEGYVNTCTADSTGYRPTDYTIQPIDKTVLVGTKPRPTLPTTP